jgi:hypothetical protein
LANKENGLNTGRTRGLKINKEFDSEQIMQVWTPENEVGQQKMLQIYDFFHAIPKTE